ncbi:response regulator [bacterium]|nr:response regulator [bacterium]
MKTNEPLKILLVDDVKQNLFILETILSTLNVDIRTAKDGLDAIQMTFQHEFSLIISDVRMPEVDGYRLVKVLRESSKFIPIILMSGIDTCEEDLLTGIGEGAIDYICRPFSHEVLLRKVRSFLAIHQKQVLYHKAKEKLLSAKAQAGAESKSMFLSTVSHEIRTPMNAILGFSGMMLEDGVSEKHLKYLKIIQESGTNLLSIIDDILDLSDFEAGKISIESDTFNLHQLLKETIDHYKSQAERSNVELLLEINPNISKYCIGDAKRLHQILINLLGNSFKFTQKGRIILYVDRQNTREITLQVVDTGRGIKKDQRKRIFEAFSQSQSAIDREFGGIGIGLTIVRNIVKLWSGDVKINSSFGDGTTVKVTLPIKEDNWQEEKVYKSEITEEIPQYEVSPELKLLCCEDQESNNELMTCFLDDLGIQATMATNGYDAIELYKQNSYDLIFMDIAMPGLSGVEVTKVIRRIEIENESSRTPIFAVTGTISSENLEYYLAIGFNGFIAKPYYLDQLRKVLSQFSKP